MGLLGTLQQVAGLTFPMVNTAVGVASNNQNIRFQQQTNQQNIDFQRHVMELNRQRFLADRENERQYNSPAHQMELLAAAGINKNLYAGSMAGSGLVNTSPMGLQTAGPSSVAPHVDNPAQNLTASEFTEPFKASEEIALSRSSRLKIASDIELNEEQRKNLEESTRRISQEVNKMIAESQFWFSNAQLDNAIKNEHFLQEEFNTAIKDHDSQYQQLLGEIRDALRTQYGNQPFIDALLGSLKGEKYAGETSEIDFYVNKANYENIIKPLQESEVWNAIQRVLTVLNMLMSGRIDVKTFEGQISDIRRSFSSAKKALTK